MTMNVLLTGATGFVGSRLLEDLVRVRGIVVKVAVRNEIGVKPNLIQVANSIVSNGIDANTNWQFAVENQDVVIHAAARAHIMQDEVEDPLSEYRRVNVAGSENLARQAAAAGVKRFIYISSVKVSGESTTLLGPFRENMIAHPEDYYGQSKYEAEEGLKLIAAETGMELVIIRPPLVYGPSVKANFRSLLKLSGLPIALPFGLINNQRSMVYLGNLVDFIICCINHPKAANEIFFVSDQEDLSLKELITLIRKEMGMRAWLVPVPSWLFRVVGRLTGKMSIVDRIVGDLRINSTKAHDLLNWSPPYNVRQGIAETVADFVKRDK